MIGIAPNVGGTVIVVSAGKCCVLSRLKWILVILVSRVKFMV